MCSLSTAVPRVSRVWQCDDSIDRARYLGGPNRLLFSFCKLPPSPVYFQVKKPTPKMFHVQANKSTRVLLIADRVIRLPSPAHPKNNNEQRVHPSLFHVATLPMRLGIQFLSCGSPDRTASFGMKHAILAFSKFLIRVSVWHYSRAPRSRLKKGLNTRCLKTFQFFLSEIASIVKQV